MNLSKEKKAMILATCVLAFLASASAEDPSMTKKVTIDEAVSLAMENNIQLSSDAIDLRIKKRAKDYSWNVFIPATTASGSIAQTNMKETSMGTELKGKDRWSETARLGMSLTVNMALFEGLRATRQSYEAGKITWEQARQDTERNVRKGFYGILVQEESLKLAKEKLAASEDRYRQTGVNYRNGLVPELTVLKTQLAVETQKPALQQSELELDQQKRQFAFLIGLPVNTTVELDGEIDPVIVSLDENTLVEKNLGNRLDIALLAKNLELLNTQVRAKQFQIFTPSITVSKDWAPSKQPIDAGEWTDNSGSFGVTLSFDLAALIPFSQTGQSLSDAKDSVRKTELALRQATYNAELEIRNLAKKLEKYRASIATMEMNVALADKAYRLTEEGYRAGTIEYLDLKDAENSLMEAKLGVITEKYNYLSTMLDLETALNANLD